VLFKKVIVKHVKSYLFIYFLVLVFLVAGIATGAFTVDALTLKQKEELVSYFQGFFSVLEKEPVQSGAVFRQSVVNNLQILLMIWFLGVTIIGIPLVLLLVGLKGFILGFSVGFLAEEMGLKGLLFSMVGILPQNLLIIPCTVAAGATSVAFSVSLLKRKKSRHKKSIASEFIAYSFGMAAIILVMLAGALVEGYVSPALMKLLTP
jgi:stage II sporulation protein M